MLSSTETHYLERVFGDRYVIGPEQVKHINPSYHSALLSVCRRVKIPHYSPHIDSTVLPGGTYFYLQMDDETVSFFAKAVRLNGGRADLMRARTALKRFLLSGEDATKILSKVHNYSEARLREFERTQQVREHLRTYGTYA